MAMKCALIGQCGTSCVNCALIGQCGTLCVNFLHKNEHCFVIVGMFFYGYIG